jgi:predicted O-methyltransferase YrrM
MKAPNKKQYPDYPTCDDRLLWDTWMSSYHYPVLCVADDLGLFPLLQDKPATTAMVAKDLSISLRAAEVLLGLMASLGFLAEHQGRFGLTEVSRNYLLPQSPYYWGPSFRGLRNNPPTFEKIREGMMRNDPVGGKIGGQHMSVAELWEPGEIEPGIAQLLTKSMRSESLASATGLALRGNFRGVNHLLDVGGGSGCFCIALAARYPKMRFTILDLPPVCEVTKQYIAEYELQDRIDTLACNMFKDPWPSGYDGVFFSNVFHDWDKELCLVLSQRSFECLPPGGRIYIHEILLDDSKTNPLVAASFSIELLLMTKGRQYSAAELDELLKECGFEDVTVVHTYGYYSLVSAQKSC